MTAREIALGVLRKVLHTDRFIPELLDEFFRRHGLSSEDKGLVTELAYGCVRRRGTLDWVTEQYAGRGMAKISAGLRDILRMGVYQLLYCDRIPRYAAVHEAVELAKRHGPRGSEKFVNAVLRKVPEHREEICFPSRSATPASYIATFHSHPLWLVERWLRRWGQSSTEALCAANNAVPPLTARVNRLKTDREGLIGKLSAEGVRPSACEGYPDAIELRNLPRPLGELASFREGLFQIQDIAGMRVAALVAVEPCEMVADLCAAPGGKCTAMAEMMGGRGEVWCMDVSAAKVRLIEENATRLGLTSLRMVIGNALQAERRLGRERFDRLLLDAPCSNTGVLGRRPEVRWRLKVADIERLAKNQRALLSAAAPCVRVGGALVYSTCSIEPDENECVVEQFLKRFPGFVIDGELRFLPHTSGCDGGYAARLLRKN